VKGVHAAWCTVRDHRSVPRESAVGGAREQDVVVVGIVEASVHPDDVDVPTRRRVRAAIDRPVGEDVAGAYVHTGLRVGYLVDEEPVDHDLTRPRDALVGRADQRDVVPAGAVAVADGMDEVEAVDQRAVDEYLGETIRCHVAKTSDELNGSAVSVSLSLKLLPTARGLSKRTIRGVLHVAPLSSENAARIALRAVELSKPIEIACSRPFGLKESHGSVAR